MIICSVFFFFSSRRRHTRSYGDWSSDVCSSDLPHGARTDHEDNHVQAVIARQDTLENQLELRCAHAGVANVPDMHAARSERAQRIGAVEQAFDDRRPTRLLVERKTLDGASSSHEDPAQAWFVRARVAAALTVGVDFEADARLELGKNARMLTHLQAHAWRPDAIPREPPDPPAGGQFGADDEDEAGERGDQDPRRHMGPMRGMGM